jgi:multiple sugar transport system permease protein
MMRSYFQDVPQEMEEASLIDGRPLAGILQNRPAVSVPGIMASALYCIIFSWNDFCLP